MVCRAPFSGKSRCSVTVQAGTAVPKQFKLVTPVGDRVLVKVDKEEARTVGGVLLPASARNRPTAGAIVAVGEGSTVKESDRVIYSKFAGTELDFANDQYVLLKEEDVIGLLPASEKISSLQPLSDRVLIKTAKADTKTSGGVLLAAESTDKPNFGLVIAVGAGKKDEDSGEVTAPNVKVGSTVMYSKYSGVEFEDFAQLPLASIV
ncbi:MAG: hypothetical protein WDW38_008309 [Sanguina aurantia]